MDVVTSRARKIPAEDAGAVAVMASSAAPAGDIA